MPVLLEDFVSVTIEGPAGSGKSLVAKAVREVAADCNFAVSVSEIQTVGIPEYTTEEASRAALQVWAKREQVFEAFLQVPVLTPCERDAFVWAHSHARRMQGKG